MLVDDLVISVTDASGLSAGDFVRIGSEILIITAVAGDDLTVARGQLGSEAVLAVAGDEVVLLQPSAVTTLSAAVDAVSTTINVTDASVLAVAGGDYLRIEDEIVRIDSVDSDSLTVTRGMLGTETSSHGSFAVVSTVDTGRTTTIDEMRLGASGSLEPASLLQNDNVLDVIKLDTFDPIPGDLLLIGDEVLRVISVTENATTWSIDVNRGEYGTPVVEVPAGSSVSVIQSNVLPIHLFASDTLDDRNIDRERVRLGVASKMRAPCAKSATLIWTLICDCRTPKASRTGASILVEAWVTLSSLGPAQATDSVPQSLQVRASPGGLSIVVPDTIDVAGLDQQQLTITNTSVAPAITTTFEFSLDANVPSGVEAVRIDGIVTVSQLVGELAQAIENADIGLAPTVDSNDPNVLRLNESFQISVDTMTTGFGTFGVAGGAVPIPFIPDRTFTSEAVAAELLEAITHQPSLGLTGFAIAADVSISPVMRIPISTRTRSA